VIAKHFVFFLSGYINYHNYVKRSRAGRINTQFQKEAAAGFGPRAAGCRPLYSVHYKAHKKASLFKNTRTSATRENKGLILWLN